MTELQMIPSVLQNSNFLTNLLNTQLSPTSFIAPPHGPITIALSLTTSPIPSLLQSPAMSSLMLQELITPGKALPALAWTIWERAIKHYGIGVVDFSMTEHIGMASILLGTTWVNACIFCQCCWRNRLKLRIAQSSYTRKGRSGHGVALR